MRTNLLFSDKYTIAKKYVDRVIDAGTDNRQFMKLFDDFVSNSTEFIKEFALQEVVESIRTLYYDNHNDAIVMGVLTNISIICEEAINQCTRINALAAVINPLLYEINQRGTVDQNDDDEW